MKNTGIGLLTVSAILGCATDFQPTTSGPGTTFGRIYVDTPEVYSRERLVNDRFRQDEWLRKKLNENPEQGLQGSMASSSRQDTTVGLALSFPQAPSPGDTQSPDSPETPEPINSPKPPTPTKHKLEKSAALQDPSDTPIAQLRDAMAYREEVRNEILENQLDDRHDINGNTLYRLKFDATVVPENDTSAYAMIEVTIKGPSDSSSKTGKSAGPGIIEMQQGQQEQRRSSGVHLPDWEWAAYVPGLDKSTLRFYTEAYANWVRDINVSLYSKDDLLYGPLQGYFEVNEGKRPLEVSEKKHCARYKSDTERDTAWKELVALNVYPEYLERGTYGSVVTDGDYEERTTYQQVCVLTGLANFIYDIQDNASAIYTYAITPKERVQRVYGDSLAAGRVGVAINAEQAGVGAALAHSNAREARANAIMRQPQLVGYSPGGLGSGKATMGWLVGPRYKISTDTGGQVSFRHVPTQHTLTGIISVPSWWTEMKLITKTYWLDENGAEFSENGKALIDGVAAEKGDEVTIYLPGDLISVASVLDPERREPKVDQSATIPDQLIACEPGSVIIRGSQLWRSTVVTLGAQQANSISVLPSMKGIIATFDNVRPSSSGKETLYLWTSEGEASAGDISVGRECKPNSK